MWANPDLHTLFLQGGAPLGKEIGHEAPMRAFSSEEDLEAATFMVLPGGRDAGSYAPPILLLPP